jgi:hypothetical protein
MRLFLKRHGVNDRSNVYAATITMWIAAIYYLSKVLLCHERRPMLLGPYQFGFNYLDPELGNRRICFLKRSRPSSKQGFGFTENVTEFVVVVCHRYILSARQSYYRCP